MSGADPDPALARGELAVTTEPVPGYRVPRLRVRGLVDAPAAAVWTVIDDTAGWARVFPRVRSASESRDGDTVRTRLTIRMPFPLRDAVEVTVGRHTPSADGGGERVWHHEQGPYRVNTGRWHIAPYGADPARTIAVYEVHLVPSIPLPRRVHAAIQDRAIRELFDAIRRAAA